MEITATGGPALTAEADHLLVFATAGDDILEGGALRQLNDALDGALTPLAASGELTGKMGGTVVLHTLGKLGEHAPARAVVSGLGPADKMTLDEIRHAAANGARRARSLAGGSLAVAVDGEDCGFSLQEVAGAITEGLDLGLYRFDRHQTPEQTPNQLERASLHGSDADAVAAGIAHGRALAGAANFARDLANEPSNLLTRPNWPPAPKPGPANTASKSKSGTKPPPPNWAWAPSWASPKAPTSPPNS